MMMTLLSNSSADGSHSLLSQVNSNSGTLDTAAISRSDYDTCLQFIFIPLFVSWRWKCRTLYSRLYTAARIARAKRSQTIFSENMKKAVHGAADAARGQAHICFDNAPEIKATPTPKVRKVEMVISSCGIVCAFFTYIYSDYNSFTAPHQISVCFLECKLTLVLVKLHGTYLAVILQISR